MAIVQSVYLGLGSNLGDSKNILINAVKFITQEIGPVTRISKVYVSEALNPPDNLTMQQADYLNMAVLSKSSLTPQEIKAVAQSIETKLGLDRTKKTFWGPRLIDIDILAVGKMIVNEKDLKIPHPEIQNRDFVLYPLMDIDANFKHPENKKSVVELLQAYNLSHKPLIKDEFTLN